MDIKSKERRPIILVIVVTLLGAFAIIWHGPPSSRFLEKQQLNQALRAKEMGAPLVEATQSALVRNYINAYQVKNCDEIIQTTWWIQERLAKLNETDTAAIDTEKARLCEELYALNTKDSMIKITGLNDQYLLSPVSTFKILGADPGRDDLAKPVLERVWIEIVYADPNTAPQLENNLSPVHSIIAGINISDDNYILKGAVRGNWEIDLTSISTQW